MIIEKCYAKINLILNVLSKRNDGYHNIDFLMCNIDLFDEIKVSESEFDEIIGMDLEIEKNLCYKVWNEFRTQFKLTDKFIKIEITKKIPLGAGMAGGSSNAAGVLRAVNKLFDKNLSLDKLAEIGLKFGSDIPFCIYQKPMRAQGQGELLTNVDIKLDQYIVVINPGFEVSTKLCYEAHKITTDHGNIDEFLKTNDMNYLHNDLETTTFNLYPEIEILKNEISAQFNKKIIMSGSGPTLLVFCSEIDIAHNIFFEYFKKYNNVYLTKMR